MDLKKLALKSRLEDWKILLKEVFHTKWRCWASPLTREGFGGATNLGREVGHRQHAFAFVNMSLLKPALYVLYEGLMEVDRVGSRGTPCICSGLGNFCRVTAEPRRKNTKK